jgi:glutamate transport system substrate-binding protein
MAHRARPFAAGIIFVLAATLTTACTSSASTAGDPTRSAVPEATISKVSVRPRPSPSAGCTSSSALVVGVKVDQFGTGYLDVRNYSYKGFDVDVATYLSSTLFNNPNPYFLPVSSDTREQALASCAIRFFAATYTISPPRQQEFDIAGPYLVTYQGVMLGPHSPRITTVSDLDGKRVCVVGGGSQAESVLNEFVPGAIASPVQTYSSCLTELRNGDVDAFSTDLAILYGYLMDPANSGLRILPGVVIGDPIYYGVAFRKSDHQLCLRAAAAIESMINSKQWQADIDIDLSDYVRDQGLYPSPLQPTNQEIAANSCQS